MRHRHQGGGALWARPRRVSTGAEGHRGHRPRRTGTEAEGPQGQRPRQVGPEAEAPRGLALVQQAPASEVPRGHCPRRVGGSMQGAPPQSTGRSATRSDNVAKTRGRFFFEFYGSLICSDTVFSCPGIAAGVGRAGSGVLTRARKEKTTQSTSEHTRNTETTPVSPRTDPGKTGK